MQKVSWQHYYYARYIIYGKCKEYRAVSMEKAQEKASGRGDLVQSLT
jgi:hypothetical protein